MNENKYVKINQILLFSLAALFIVLALSGTNRNNKPKSFNDDQKNIGIYLDEWSELKKFAETPDIIGWFENWYGPRSFNKLKLCYENKTAIPLITWQPQNISLQEIAAGVHDEYITSYIQNITDIAPDMDILIRFAHEMEMRPTYRFAWYSWQAEKNPSAFIEAWQHIVAVSRQVNPKIKWVWSPNRADKYSDPFYPGDEYVDYISVTMNLRGDNEKFAEYRNFQSFYEDIGIREHLEKYGKKIIISELGYSSQSIPEKKEYLKSIFDFFQKDTHIIAVIFFDKNSGEYGQYKISDNKDLINTFNGIVSEIVKNRDSQNQ